MANLRFNSQIGSRRVTPLTTTPYSHTQATRSARIGMRQVIANYRRLVKHIEDVTPEVLLDALQPTFAKSQVYCPKDTGKLAKSGYLQITQFRGVPTVEIGYGLGGEPAYAAVVHENMEWDHKAPTRAKWLQVALAEDAQEIQNRLVSSLRSIF